MTASESFTWRSEFVWLMAAVLLAVGTATIPLSRDPLFFFLDDFQLQFMPMFGEIARLLKSGELPFLTDRIWHGGAILGEYQFAVFNPVSLGAYLIIDEVDQINLAAALFALIHIAILAGGLFVLARNLGADQMASLMAAVVGATSSWLIHWGASTWIPALVGASWFPWALWGLLKAYRDRRWVIPAAVLSYMVLVSGWPYANVALIVTIVIAVPVLFYREKQFAACFRVCLASGAALLLSAPAIFSVLGFLSESTRVQDLSILRTSLDAMVLALGVPIFPDLWRIWDGSYRLVASPPMYYLSWFVPFVLANALVQRSNFSSSTQKIVLWSITVAFAVLSLSPALWNFRYSFRFLPYYHFSIILLVAIFVTEQRRSTNGTGWSLWPTGIVLVAPFSVAIVNAPTIWLTQVQTALTITLAVMIVMWCQRRRMIHWPAILVVGHVFLFFVLTLVTPPNSLVSDWRPPLARVEFDAQPVVDLRTFSLYPRVGQTETVVGGRDKLPTEYWAIVAPGNTALYRRAETVNGYAPTVQRGFVENFCIQLRGSTCGEGPLRVLAVEPQTNLSFLDLTGVERVVATRGTYSTLFAGHTGQGWAIVEETELVHVFERTVPQQRRGNIIRWPDGLQIQKRNSTASSETYSLSSDHAGGRVIVARAWYPGFRAHLNGNPIRVEPIAGLVPSLVLPADAQGELVIEYWPAGLNAGIFAAIVGILVLLVFATAPLLMRKIKI